jgi:hypothetical protein
VSLGLASAQAAKPPCSEAEKPKDITGGTKNAIACQWLRPAQIPHLLKAMSLYMEGDTASVRDALSELLKDPLADEDLYAAAEENGVDLLEVVATANTRKTSMMNEHEKNQLYSEAESLIQEIFDKSKEGKKALVKINGLFIHGPKYKDLFELMSSIPENEQKYATDLEILRAAYATDPKRLAKLVADKISAPQK